jgi:hypothetical protein
VTECKIGNLGWSTNDQALQETYRDCRKKALQEGDEVGEVLIDSSDEVLIDSSDDNRLF